MRSPRGARRATRDAAHGGDSKRKNGNVQNTETDGGTGPVIKMSGREEALVSFFLSLLERLQGLATAPAMMFGEYKKALGGDEG